MVETKKRYNIFIRFAKGLGVAVLWMLLLLLPSWVYIQFTDIYRLDVIVFFAMLLINCLMFLTLIAQLGFLDQMSIEEGIAKEKLITLRVSYGILGAIFGIASCILIILGHALIYFLCGLALVANKLMFGPYDIMLLILSISVLLAYVIAGIKSVK